MKLHSYPGLWYPGYCIASPRLLRLILCGVKEEWRPKSSQSCGRSTSCQSKSFKALFVEILCEERKDLYLQQLSVAQKTRITFCFAFIQQLQDGIGNVLLPICLVTKQKVFSPTETSNQTGLAGKYSSFLYLITRIQS